MSYQEKELNNGRLAMVALAASSSTRYGNVDDVLFKPLVEAGVRADVCRLCVWLPKGRELALCRRASSRDAVAAAHFAALDGDAGPHGRRRTGRLACHGRAAARTNGSNLSSPTQLRELRHRGRASDGPRNPGRSRPRPQ